MCEWPLQGSHVYNQDWSEKKNNSTDKKKETPTETQPSPEAPGF